MTRIFKPRADWVLVRPETTPVKHAGLAIAPSQLEEPTVGVVIAAGPDALKAEMVLDPEKGYEVINSGRNPHGVKIGETVQWDRFAGRDIGVNGEKLKRLRLEEIAGAWEEVSE